MWSIRQRFRQSGPLIVICSFLLATGFLLQIHTWYINHQKHNRILGYNIYLKELTDTMNNIQRVANKTSTLLKKLEKAQSNNNTEKYRAKQRIS